MLTQEPSHRTNGVTEPSGDGQRGWRDTFAPWRNTSLAVLPTFLLTRLLLLVLTYFGGVLFNVPNNSAFALTFNTVFYSWYHWDAPRYLTIASQGYIDRSYVGFFPLYPTLVHTFSILFHLDILLTGMLIANLSFFAALIVLYRLVEQEFDRETAARSILYISIFPTALLFFNAYNTSTSLFLAIFCFYLLRHSHWWMAGFIGMLAALTDLIGILLFIVFLCEFLRQYTTAHPEGTYVQKKHSRVIALLPLIAALLIPLGLKVYSDALTRKALDPFAFLHPQATASLLPPWMTIITLLKSLTGNSPYSFAGTHSLFELLLFLLLLTTLILCGKGPVRLAQDQWPFTIFSVLILLYVLIFPHLPEGVQSPYDPMPALLTANLELFIGIIILARLGKYAWFHSGYLMFSLPMLAFFTFQLFTGHWMI
jgi:Gpi18-like mannosyltransferase